MIYENGVIWTGDPARPWADFLWVEGDRIRGVGTASAAVAGAEGESGRVDLEGRFLCPGLIDAHAHVLGFGLGFSRVDLTGAASLEEALARVRAFRANGDEVWLRGRGWDQNLWTKPVLPDRRGLDAATGDRPACLTRVDGHAFWVNTRALELAGINAATEDPRGGRIVRDEDGSPTGILIDTAQELVTSVLPPVEDKTKRRAIREATRALTRVGLTGVHDMGVSVADIEHYRRLAGNGELPLRIYAAVTATDPDLASVLGRGPDREWAGGFRLGAVKFFVDGALGSRGAALLESYADDPGNTGLVILESEALERGLQAALSAGFQCAVHAIGDRANRIVLDTWEHIVRSGTDAARGRDVPEAPLSLVGPVAPVLPPVRLEHAQVIHPDDLPRVGGLGIVASVQPVHCPRDMLWARGRLGDHRLTGAYAWRSLIAGGAVLVAGSDVPVESPDPLRGLHAAVTRRPVGAGDRGARSSAQTLARDEALAAFTAAPAYASGDLHRLGTLTPGKLADFVVFDRNLVTCDPEAIPDARVLLTVVGGKAVWADEGVSVASSPSRSG